MITWETIIHYTQKGNPKPKRRVELSEAEWRSKLSESQFRIAREKGTERPFSGEHCHSHKNGKYACTCCGELLFDSGEKFESGTGWPSFDQPIAIEAIKYHKDVGFGMVRVEVLCNVCDAHLGHVFPDGPKPNGLRYCINSEVITLIEN